MNNLESKHELDPQPAAGMTVPAVPDSNSQNPGKWVVYFFAFNVILLAVKGALTYLFLILSLYAANALKPDSNTLMMMDVITFFITSVCIFFVMRPIIAKFFLDRYYIKGALLTAAILQFIGSLITFTAPVAMSMKIINFIQVLLPAIACLLLAFQNYDRHISNDKKCYNKKAKIILVVSAFFINIAFNILRSPAMLNSMIEKLFG